MADLEKLTRSLRERGYQVERFATGAEAADWMDRAIDGKTVGFGGCLTAEQMGLYPRLSTHNRCFWHWKGDAREACMSTDVYITSVNAVAETGELVNIDGTGNRVASTLFGHRQVYFVVGSNKVAADYDAALWRARNVASPRNAQRLGRRTPCAVKADRCYDCDSPERICRGLVVLWEKMMDVDMTVVLIEEELGL